LVDDVGEAMDDGAGFAGAPGQFYFAEELGAAWGWFEWDADDVWGGDVADAGGGDGDA
jgi:hypothetical protein